MAELLFIATTIFVAYVVFVVLGGKTEKSDGRKPEPVKPLAEKTVTAEAASPVLAEKVAAKPAPAKTAVSPKPAASKTKTPAKKAAPAKATAVEQASATPTPAPLNDSLKNPKTGEVAKVPASYAFAKRWIKDALVEEGLLEKVYKNNELDDATNTKIQAALQQLRAMDKYQ